MNEIRIGDCVDLMRQMVAEGIRVQTCITSPPYYGLRDYGTASWEDGDLDCDHVPPQSQGTTGQRADRTFTATVPYRDVCGKCGAVRIDSQLGLEKSPAEYLEKMVDVFRLVRELLADDGTLWLNMGDSYAGGKIGRADAERNNVDGFSGGQKFKGESFSKRPVPDDFKPKDLMGMPWRLAFALQADGWYLRSDIIWHKPNPMPESVTDRPTKSHEYIFLLSKSEQYFYDADAIRTPATCETLSVPSGWAVGEANHSAVAHNRPQENGKRKSWPSGGLESGSGGMKGDAPRTTDPAGANKRSVWTVATEAYSEAHFATFPRALIVPCVLAGSRAGNIVFDPFMGSGTTALVAKENGRRYLGCELNPAYKMLQDERLRQEVLFG